jgi:inositol transport system ATP-binding protein
VSIKAEKIINDSIKGATLNESNQFILEMREMVKHFPGVKAVDNVTLNVRPGTVHALIGENGAGKSTMMKILAGEHYPDGGEIYFEGKKVDITNTKDAFDIGVSTIYQELNLVNEMTIAENMFLGREPLKGIFVDHNYIYQETEQYLKNIGLNFNPRTKLKELTVANQQMVEIAKGLNRNAKLIILDEPTSAISDTEVDTLFKLINELKAKGITFIYISHKLDEIFTISDEVTVMRDGGWVDTVPTKDLNKDKLISLMVGRELTNLFPKIEVDVGDVVFEAKGLTRGKAFQDVSFDLRRGEILGVAGLIGAGRTETARAIFGLDQLDSGSLVLDGKPFVAKHPIDAIQRGIAYVPEDRKYLGLCVDRPILENITLTNLETYSKYGLLNTKQMTIESDEIGKQLQIKMASLNVPAKNLSGGNQQKVVLAKWLIRNLKVLILDEPTRGIDVGAKSEIHKLMSQFASEGMAIIMISSELPEILGMSDRVLVMHEGKVGGILSREEATQENIMHLATGEV